MPETREEVVELLKSYQAKKKKIALLEYEREHPAKITDGEVIDAMALSHPIGEGLRQSAHVSDKTLQIALHFQEKKDRLNFETVLEITQELRMLEQEVERLDFYVAQLEREQAEVIRAYYFLGKSWRDLQREMHLSSRTLIKRRDDGLDALVEMYRYLGSVTGGSQKKSKAT